jgi:hypothetical protein
VKLAKCGLTSIQTEGDNGFWQGWFQKPVC